MNGTREAPPTLHRPSRPVEVNAGTVLGVCTSLKPAPGREGKSAARSLLAHTLSTLRTAYPNVSLLDLHDHPVPFFDGRLPQEHDDASLKFVLACVERAGALLLSVPAYWSGVSGVFKNFVDVLCGPAYDMEGRIETAFSEKPIGLLIVGAEGVSARAGAEQAWQIMQSVGASLVGEPVVVSNPRSGSVDLEATHDELVTLGAELVRRAHFAGKQTA